MSRWRRVVRRELARYGEQTDSDVVSLSELYEQILPVLRVAFPDNNHPRAKLRQVLQQLADRDELAFVDGAGTYRILDLGTTAAATEFDVTYTAAEYETVTRTRSMPLAFRRAILGRYGTRCPVSGVDLAALLDVAHVLPWSDYPDHRTDPGNVLVLDRTHHAAFDAELFTIDADLRLRVAPDLETESAVLRRTLLGGVGKPVEFPGDAPDITSALSRRNRELAWT